MPVDGVSGSTGGSNTDHKPQVPVTDDFSYSPSYTISAPTKELQSTDFLKLLAAQLRYQDMTNPMSNSEMMSTLTQMASMNATTSMISSMTSMTSSMNDVLTVNLTSYATGMMGKEVTVALVDKDGKLTGEGVSLYEGSPMVYVDGKKYDLSQVMTVGEVPKQEEEDKSDGEDTQQKEQQTQTQNV